MEELATVIFVSQPHHAGVTNRIAVSAGVSSCRGSPSAPATLRPGLLDLYSHRLLHPYDVGPWDDQALKDVLERQTAERPLRRDRAADLKKAQAGRSNKSVSIQVTLTELRCTSIRT